MEIAYLVHGYRRLYSVSKAVICEKTPDFVYSDVAVMLFIESFSLDSVRIFLLGTYVTVTSGYPCISPPSALPCTYMGDLYLASTMNHDT